MRVERSQNAVTVSVDSSEIGDFCDSWPAACNLRDLEGVTFTFDSRNGDLVDITYENGDSDDWDGPALVALSQDAQDQAGLAAAGGRHTPNATVGDRSRFTAGFEAGQRDRSHHRPRPLCSSRGSDQVAPGSLNPVVKSDDHAYYHGYKAASEGAASEPSAFLHYQSKHRRGGSGARIMAANMRRNPHLNLSGNFDFGIGTPSEHRRNGFMEAEVVGPADWIIVDTKMGGWVIPYDVVKSSDPEDVVQYTEARTRADIYEIEVKHGYGVRMSAPGYLDATDWEFYETEKEAIERAHEMEAEGSEFEENARKKRVRHPDPAQTAYLEAYEFFYEHAGFPSPEGATAAQKKRAHSEAAASLAEAEVEAKKLGWTVEWEEDTDADSSWMDEEQVSDLESGRMEILVALLKNENDEVIGSLGGVTVMSPSFIQGVPQDPYLRVVEAELAVEALHNEREAGKSMALNPRRRPRHASPTAAPIPPSHEAPPRSFESAGGRRFTLGAKGPREESSPGRWTEMWPIVYNGEPAGKLFHSTTYGANLPWHATTRELVWKYAKDAPTGIGFDVAAFATAELALAAWGRSADEILDWADGKEVYTPYSGRRQRANARGGAGDAERRARSWMEIHANEFEDRRTGEVNRTALAEAAANQVGHNEWLDDSTHPIWDWSCDAAEGHELATLGYTGNGSGEGERLDTLPSGKTLHQPDGPPYTIRLKLPKFNGETTILAHPTDIPSGVVARLFPGWTKEDHGMAATLMDRTRHLAGVEWQRAVDDAVRKYGKEGPLVSGVYRDHFPREVKDTLRHLAHYETAANDAAHFHHRATGARKPFRSRS